MTIPRHLKVLLVYVCLLTASVATLEAGATPVDNPSTHDCLGVERSVRNSAGGDRAHGGFGPVQSEFVKLTQPYGQTQLEPFLSACRP